MQELPLHEFQTVRRLAPLVSIDMIIRDGADRVLLGYRRNEPAQGIWFVPGGRIRKDERLADAFARLLRDELGDPAALGISPRFADAAFKGVYEHLYPPTATVPYSIHYVVLACELRAGPAQAALPQSQHDQWRWFDVSEIVSNPQVHANTRAYFT